ncbi:MAG: ferritin family protein [Candidatus Omnitrophota bacterium]
MRVHIDKSGKISIFDFSPAQAYKAAVHMEKEGIQFYQDLTRQIKDPDARREVDFLIEQEQEHLKTFENLLEYVKKGAGDEFEEDDIAQYVSSNVFDTTLEKDAMAKMEHRHTALEEAMNMERRSIVFYQACHENSTDPQAKGAFEKIGREEKKHLEKFAELLRVKCINSQKGCLL